MSLVTQPVKGCHVFDSWQFTPEGAAVHVESQIAIIADLHLGYEWARGAAGDCIPAHSLDETLMRLRLLLARIPISQLVVAGDLVESARPCRRTLEDLDAFTSWLKERGVSLVVLEGNHDRGLFAGNHRATRFGLCRSQHTLTVAGWTIAHGHLAPVGERTITGHHHPVLRVSGVGAPCFLAGPLHIVLPAFSCNAAGCDVRSASLPAEWFTSSLDCIVSTGSELLDFGPLLRLRAPSARLSS